MSPDARAEIREYAVSPDAQAEIRQHARRVRSQGAIPNCAVSRKTWVGVQWPTRQDQGLLR